MNAPMTFFLLFAGSSEDVNELPEGLRRIAFMARSLITLAVAAALSCTAFAQGGSAKRIIADQELALGEAMIHKDVATLSRLIADDWAMQSESGAGTKANFIADIKSGKLVVSSFKIYNMHVNVVGNLAWVQATDDEHTSYDGNNSSGTYNWMDVWEIRKGHWISVATQLTRMKR